MHDPDARVVTVFGLALFVQLLDVPTHQWLLGLEKVNDPWAKYDCEATVEDWLTLFWVELLVLIVVDDVSGPVLHLVGEVALEDVFVNFGDIAESVDGFICLLLQLLDHIVKTWSRFLHVILGLNSGLHGTSKVDIAWATLSSFSTGLLFFYRHFFILKYLYFPEIS